MSAGAGPCSHPCNPFTAARLDGWDGAAAGPRGTLRALVWELTVQHFPAENSTKRPALLVSVPIDDHTYNASPRATRNDNPSETIAASMAAWTKILEYAIRKLTRQGHKIGSQV